MKKRMLCALFVSAFFSINAQSAQNVEKGLFKLNALLPGASYELGIANNATLNFDAFLLPAADEDFFGDVRFGILPGLQAEFRYYVNFNRRLSKGKNIAGNSGNYVGAVNQFYLGDALIGDFEFTSSFFNNVGIVYGIQRTRPKSFYWNISFGPGLIIDEFDADAALFIDIKLGWVMSKRK